MKRWYTGDLHIHSHLCGDGHLPIAEIVRRSRKYCDFFGIAGHARLNSGPNYVDGTWGRPQYEEIKEVRKMFPDVPIFHLGEVEFPIPRHTIFVTLPENREYELANTLVQKYGRDKVGIGADIAQEEMRFVEKNWGLENTFMIFNHPNAPDVSYEDLEKIASASDMFRTIVCYGRNDRRAKQTWDVGGEWDRLLMKGYKLFVRFEGDFHQHFEEGGKDYYPGEFQQDRLHLEELTYASIIRAYQTGQYYSVVDNLISDPEFRVKTENGISRINLEFQVNDPLEEVLIIAEGETVMRFTDIAPGRFVKELELPEKKYFRVRGLGAPKKRKYSEGEFQPVFMFNPIFKEGEL